MSIRSKIRNSKIGFSKDELQFLQKSTLNFPTDGLLKISVINKIKILLLEFK